MSITVAAEHRYCCRHMRVHPIMHTSMKVRLFLLTPGVHHLLLQLAPSGETPPPAPPPQSPRSSRTPPPPPPPPPPHQSLSAASDSEGEAQPALVSMLLDGTLPELLRSAVGHPPAVAPLLASASGGGSASGLQHDASAPAGAPLPRPPPLALERMLGQVRRMGRWSGGGREDTGGRLKGWGKGGG